MKKIIAGADPQNCSCTSAGGCGVAMTQFSWGWDMTVCCDGDCVVYSGQGEYGGTACEGQCPDWNIHRA